MKISVYLCALLLLVPLCLRAFGESPKADSQAAWTILVFMNGDNSLEPDAVDNFRQMAKVGSSDRVNIVVQFDRLSADNHLTTPDWSQTLRFRVTRDMEPIPGNALQDIGEANMGDPQVLTDFIAWGRRTFPAHHYMLVIWDHGQGYRTLMEQRIAATQQARLSTMNIESGHPTRIAPLVRGAGGGSYRTISQDDTNHDKLYGKEIQTALSESLAGDTLDLISYDACLMAMVETAYSVRNFAKIMVGSEELEPGPGWNYEFWLKPLVEHPEMSGTELAKVLVDSYARNYAPGSELEDGATTLSALDLSKISALANAISELSDILIQNLNGDKATVQDVRDTCEEYATGKKIYHIDFGHFLDLMESQTHNAQIRFGIRRVRALISSSVIKNYAGDDRRGNWGSTGLAIYFPKNIRLYQTDPYSESGYEKDNTFMPVDFVREQRWSDFLHAYWAATRQ